ncbi:hypothetical protein H7F15_11000 [Pontibacter sp. Tf4]|uniref:hypothetical protein n=1 Tax=Pontibacter sp. Tf4 TaxID=2761620 RepID=UPI001627769B|nr:hypothetical protein [Pontibacter sp. Tf4]MBB6611565.1 hypothetical protein [Pontibacter sp. Tf4]
MKQFTAILLLLIYTCSGSTFQELRKAPVLVEHYLEHKILDEDLSLVEYVVIHYLSGSEKDADYTRDLQLPFRCADFLTTAFAIAFIPAHFLELSFLAPLPEQLNYTVLKDRFELLRLPTAIWQPPQL